jgi:hypothetical protein
MLRAEEGDGRLFAKQIVCQIVGVAAYLPEHSQREDVPAHAQYPLAVTEEVGCLAKQKGEYVVVEIQIFFVQTLYIVQMHLYGIAVEGGQQMFGYDVAVQHHIHLIAVYPLWHLTLARDNKMYLAYEGHVLLYTAEQIFQCAPVAKAFLYDRGVGMLFVFLLPYGV